MPSASGACERVRSSRGHRLHAGGASNIDPYAEGPSEDNEWIQEGPHLMLIGPPALLEAFPADPDNGGPYLMWKGTDYQHLMIPVGAR